MKICKRFFPLFVFMVMGLAAIASPAAVLGGRTALIIGIGSYERPEVPSLSGVAEDMKSALLISNAMGIPDKNIRMLRNQEASKQGILAALRELGESTEDGARTFIYYSGHGTRWQDPQAGGCVEGLLSYDSQVITNSEIAAITSKLSEKADKFVTMFDACHSAGVAPQLGTRALGGAQFAPKFFLKSGAAENTCSQPSNLRTRGLLGESTRLGALPENFVQITSSLSTEVSFDEPGKGGLATQAVRDCLLGKAVDLDGSGAITMAEVQLCAQAIINKKLQNVAGLQPHHVTISGMRNLIPVQAPKPRPVAPTPQAPVAAVAPPVSAAQNTALAVNSATQTPPTVQPQAPAAPSAAPAQPMSLPVALPLPSASTQAAVADTSAAAEPVALGAAPLAVAPPKPVHVEPVLASLATLRDIEQQANPKRKVQVKLSQSALRIGKTGLDLTVTSNHDGYVYLVLLGSDAKSFYLLFPNGLDGDNRIRAGQALRLPRPDWQVMAAGPAGTDHLLVMVADSPRKLDGLTMAEPTAAEPFTYALNTLGGRVALINFLTASAMPGDSESFGTQRVSLKEIP